MNKPAKMLELFGISQNLLATRLGVHRSLIAKWMRRGYIPPQNNSRIRELAAEDGVEMMDLEPLLLEDVCPCCKQPLPVGVTVPDRFWRIA